MSLPVSPATVGLALVSLWQAVQMGACVTAVHRARRRTTSAPGNAASPDRVTLFRPCRGAERGLAERLARTGGATHVVFAVASAEDEAYSAVLEASEKLGTEGVEVACVLTSPEGPNMKVDQLGRALRATPPREAVLVVDSDVDLKGFPALELAGAVLDGPVGAVYAPASETSSETFGDRANLAVLTGSLHAFSLLAGIDPDGFVGKVFAVRREVLERTGGFEGLRTVLGEDVELGRRVRAQGEQTRVFRRGARAVGSGRSWDDTVARFARWLGVVRASRPSLLLSYPLLIAGTLPSMLVAVALLPWITEPASLRGLAVLTTLATVLSRAWVSHAARALAGVGGSWLDSLLDAPLSELVLLTALARALSRSTVSWRGTTLEVRRGEPLRLVGPPAENSKKDR
jgi:ceramide glucosyltransferase